MQTKLIQSGAKVTQKVIEEPRIDFKDHSCTNERMYDDDVIFIYMPFWSNYWREINFLVVNYTHNVDFIRIKYRIGLFTSKK